MEYTRLTNLEVTGELKVDGSAVLPGGGGGFEFSKYKLGEEDDYTLPDDKKTGVLVLTTERWGEEAADQTLGIGTDFQGIVIFEPDINAIGLVDISLYPDDTSNPIGTITPGKAYLVYWPNETVTQQEIITIG